MTFQPVDRRRWGLRPANQPASCPMLAPAGLWHLHEPFNPNRGLWPEELTYADAAESRPDVDRLVEGLLGGGHRGALRLPRSGRWFLPLRLLPITPRRVLIKDPSAAFLSEYLARRHGMRVVIVFRHPAAVVGSLLRLGWPTGRLVETLRARPALMDGPLGPLAEAYAATNSPAQLAEMLRDSEENAMKRLVAAGAFMVLGRTDAGRTSASAALLGVAKDEDGAPLVRKTAAALTAWLGERFIGARIEADLDATPALQLERDALWSRLEAASFLSDAERRRMAGLEG